MAMEISSVYNSYASTCISGTDIKKQTESKAATKADKTNSSSAARAGTSEYLAEFLSKMESDSKRATEYEKKLADIPAACKWGESMIRAMTGNTVYEFRFYIDKNGNMSAGSVNGPSEKREMFERSRQRAKQQKEEFDKRIKEKIASSKDGMIYLYGTDIKAINGINGAKTQMGQMGMNQATDSYSRNIQNQIVSSNKEMTLEEKMKKRQEIHLKH